MRVTQRQKQRNEKGELFCVWRFSLALAMRIEGLENVIRLLKRW
jgi:hypothetical protein